MRTILLAPIALIGLIAAATPARAEPTCYQLSADGKAWNKTPELLCVEEAKAPQHTITLKVGFPTPAEIARFELALINRVRCLDCNEDVFAVANPENTVLNALKISFKGKRDVQKKEETGTVSIGSTTFHYRSKPRPAAPPSPPPAAPSKP